MPEDKWCSLSREDLENALNEMGAVLDVSVGDLIIITNKSTRSSN